MKHKKSKTNAKQFILFLRKRTQPKQKREKHEMKLLQNFELIRDSAQRYHKNLPAPGLTNKRDVLSMIYGRPNPPRYNHAL